MADVFAYTDYRKFLADYYSQNKARNPAFSYQMLSDKAGFPNRGFVYNVIAGSKNLSKSSAVKLSQAIGMNPKEADYFENLVSFIQAKNLKERNYFFDKLSAIKGNRQGSALVRETRKEQYEYYSKWYYSAIRSFIDMHQFKDDYRLLAKSLYPRIKNKEAKKAVLILEKMGMIKKNRNGYFEVSEKTITAGKEIVQLGLLNFHLQAAELAKKAIQDLPKEKRNISGLTLGISRKTYEAMCREIEAFQSKLLAMAEQDKEADSVYQMNFHFFPVANVNRAAAGKE